MKGDMQVRAASCRTEPEPATSCGTRLTQAVRVMFSVGEGWKLGNLEVYVFTPPRLIARHRKG